MDRIPLGPKPLRATAQRSTSRLLLFFSCCAAAWLTVASAQATWRQDTPPDQQQAEIGLANGGMESGEGDSVADWRFLVPGGTGNELTAVTDDVTEGERAARLDLSEIEISGNGFANLTQSVDAEPLQGKRVRFRAAVKVQGAGAQDRVQLWFRVDRKAEDGNTPMGFFDNMQDRPIMAGDWQHYEIVGDIADDAERIVLGFLGFGNCIALIDDVSLEVVERSVNQTGISVQQSEEPPQAFFNIWLTLPAIALILFGLSHAGRSWLSRFAFRFSLFYWILYCFPTLTSRLIPEYGGMISAWYNQSVIDKVVRWTAADVLRLNYELVPAFGNGSGDTTFAYVQILVGFVLAIALALIWSLIDWRKTDQRHLKDLLRSYLRYVLAATMLGYGLAKLGVVTNQFPSPGTARLSGTFGDASPMGLAWTFMGASRAYTFFAGAGETLAAFLLIWRRTTLFGVLVSTAVMLNIVMLNFCYDIPVKQYSTHLLVMGLFIGLPDFPRVARLFFINKPVAATSFRPPFCNDKTIWLHRLFKAYMIVMAIAWPTYEFVANELEMSDAAQVLGEWRPVENEEADEESPLMSLLFRPNYGAVNSGPNELAFVITTTNGPTVLGTATVERDRITFKPQGQSVSWSGEFEWSTVDGKLRLTAADDKTQEFVLEPAHNKFLLMRRGFRWINERPYNR